MPLTPSSVKRSTDATGDDIKTFSDAGKTVQVTADLAAFQTNNLDEATATVTYIGKERVDGAWLVMKMDTSSGIALTYATVVNNAAILSYAAAWAARATLTFSSYGSAF